MPGDMLDSIHPSMARSQQHGLVVEYIVAIDVTRARFPADAYSFTQSELIVMLWLAWTHWDMFVSSVASTAMACGERNNMDALEFEPRALRMRSGCDTTTPRAPALLDRQGIDRS